MRNTTNRRKERGAGGRNRKKRDEKETILDHHQNTVAGAGFTITSLRINHRVYLFGAPGSAARAERFVKDIVNPAVHTWQVTAA